MSIPLTIEQAITLKLYLKKKRRSVEEKTKKFCQSWTRRLHGDKSNKTVESLCFTRTFLDLMSKLDHPTSNLQRIAAKMATDRFSEHTVAESAGLAKQALSRFDGCNFPGISPQTCHSDRDWKDMATSIFFKPEGSGFSFMQALTSTVPDPRKDLGNAAPGRPFTRMPEFQKDCAEKFRNQQLPPEIQEVMARVIDDDARVLRTPSINLIDVWARDPWREEDDPQGQTVRFGEVHEESLTLWERIAPEESGQKTLNTDVELDDPECMILQEDESDGRQQFFVDVKPGQVVTLKGSGFINTRTGTRIDFRRFDTADTQGRMIFQDSWEGVPGLDDQQFDVHGSSDGPLPDDQPTTYNRDTIVFEWPSAASQPGLYRLQFEFVNDTEHYIEITQDPQNCEITMVKDGVVTANAIYFVVVPDVQPQQVQVVGSEVHCADETDPEEFMFVNLADDVIYELTGELLEMKFDPDESDPSLAFSIDGVGSPVQVDGQRRFFDAPDTWQSALRAFPGDGQIFETLGLNQLVNVQMGLFETDSELDQAMLNAALVIAAIALVLLILVLAVATIIILIATGVVAVASFGAGAALTLLVGALAVFITSAAFTALISVINMLVNALPSIEIIGAGGTGFSGLELAHRVSPLRIHQLFWPAERPDVDDPSANLSRISSEITDGGYREVFRVENLGGRYELTIAVTRI